MSHSLPLPGTAGNSAGFGIEDLGTEELGSRYNEYDYCPYDSWDGRSGGFFVDAADDLHRSGLGRWHEMPYAGHFGHIS